MAYSIGDAVRDLRPVLDKAPCHATTGEWRATTMQAGTSTQSGGYRNAEGKYVGVETTDPGRIIDVIIEKLEAAQTQRFNVVVIRWTKPKLPFLKSRITIETLFDEAIVPRGANDPIYETAASARLTFWKQRGAVSDGFAAERGEANIYNQTKWFGPHRYVLSITTPEKLLLATDGLSTPWAGVAERENGAGCELFLSLDFPPANGQSVDDWANLLINLGDLVADGYQVADDVEKYGAILFCRLADDFSPMGRIILSRDPGRIEGLPFGPVPLIRVTPIAEAEQEGLDQSDDWSARAAGDVLAKRNIAF